jgi:hypothetical protein
LGYAAAALPLAGLRAGLRAALPLAAAFASPAIRRLGRHAVGQHQRHDPVIGPVVPDGRAPRPGRAAGGAAPDPPAALGTERT